MKGIYFSLQVKQEAKLNVFLWDLKPGIKLDKNVYKYRLQNKTQSNIKLVVFTNQNLPKLNDYLMFLPVINLYFYCLCRAQPNTVTLGGPSRFVCMQPLWPPSTASPLKTKVKICSPVVDEASSCSHGDLSCSPFWASVPSGSASAEHILSGAALFRQPNRRWI